MILQYFGMFVVAFFLYIGIDHIWLTHISTDLYINGLKPLLRLTADGKLQPVIWPAILTYIVMAIGLVAFVFPKIQKAPHSYGLIQALFWGALFGFIIYSVYDFTNYSIMAAYPLKVAFVDILWGTLLSGIVSVLVTLIFRLA